MSIGCLSIDFPQGCLAIYVRGMCLGVVASDLVRVNLVSMVCVFAQSLWIPMRLAEVRGEARRVSDDAPLAALVAPPFPGCSEELLAAQVVEGTARVLLVCGDAFDWERPRVQARVLRALRLEVPLASVAAPFTQRLRLPLQRAGLLDHVGVIRASLVHSPLGPLVLKVRGMCPFCAGKGSLDIAHLLIRPAVFAAPAALWPRSLWPPSSERARCYCGVGAEPPHRALVVVASDAIWSA